MFVIYAFFFGIILTWIAVLVIEFGIDSFEFERWIILRNKLKHIYQIIVADIYFNVLKFYEKLHFIHFFKSPGQKWKSLITTESSCADFDHIVGA